MYLINKYDIIFQFVLFILQIAVLLTTKSFALYLVMNIVCSFFCNILKVKKNEEVYPFLKDKEKVELDDKEKKSIFKNLSSLFFYKLGSVIQNNTDNILISIFVGTITVGYYSNYTTIIASITTFLTLIFTSLKASIGNYNVKESKENQLKLFNIFEVYNFWIVGFCTICFMVLIPDFIRICFGEEYLLSFGLLICASLNFYTSNIRQVIWSYRETTGIFNKTKYITIVTSLVNIILSLILGYFYGLVGIVGATVIARLLYAWWKEPEILFGDYFKSSPKIYYINYIKRIILCSLMIMIILLICNLVNISNIYINFIVRGIICCALSVVIFYFIYRKSEAMKYLKNNIFKKLKGA